MIVSRSTIGAFAVGKMKIPASSSRPSVAVASAKARASAAVLHAVTSPVSRAPSRAAGKANVQPSPSIAVGRGSASSSSSPSPSVDVTTPATSAAASGGGASTFDAGAASMLPATAGAGPVESVPVKDASVSASFSLPDGAVYALMAVGLVVGGYLLWKKKGRK